MNLPNRLTLFRMVLIPLIVLIYLFPYAQFNIELLNYSFGAVRLSAANLLCLVLYLIACLTDFLDGRIARAQRLQTTFGKFADPIANKMLAGALLIMFASKGIINAVPVIIMVCREFVTDGCRIIGAFNGNEVQTQMLDTVMGVSQKVSIILILLNNLPFELWQLPLSDIALWFSAFVSVAGGIAIFNQLKEDILESK